MTKLLYDIYTVSIKNKSRREKLKLLQQELNSYALLTDDHISFASLDGISYPDIIIDSLAEKSFVYAAKIEANKVYLLIYISNEIVFSGLLDEKSLKSKLLLYKSRLKNDIVCYSFQYDYSNSITSSISSKIKTIDYDFAKSVDQSKYLLKPSLAIKTQILKPIFRKIQLSALLLVIVGGFYSCHLYQSHKSHQRQMLVAQKQIDLWKGYRNAVRGVAIDIEIKDMFNQLSKTRLLGDTAIKEFKYQNGKLDITLAKFNHPAMHLQDWANHNQFSIDQLTAQDIGLSKMITENSAGHSDTIVNADRLKAWVIDFYNTESNTESLTFETDTNHPNYKIITCKLAIKNFPEKLLTTQFATMHHYPIRLSSVDGYITLGNFSGSITFKIIGGLS